MKNIKNYIESGILELYVLGVANAQETTDVEEMALLHEEIRNEIESLSLAIEEYAQQSAVVPDPTIRPMLLATIDYTERLKNGELPSFPPVLHNDSKISDFSDWLNRSDIILPGDFQDFYVKIIGHTPLVTTAIVWIKEMAPQEIHEHEYEKFLILEGTCDINIEGEVYHLGAGDALSIPLYKKHDVKITSSIPCKAILQRIAA